MELEFIERYYTSKKCTFDGSILSENDVKSIYNLIKFNITRPDNELTSNQMQYYGTHYHIINDIDNMKKYYLMGVKEGNMGAMNNLGFYYQHMNDIDNMMKYYLMAIEKGESLAMYNLGSYYDKTNDIDNMIKYYLMAIEKGNSLAMNNLGAYCGNINDIDNMMKYYLMAIEKGNLNVHEINIEKLIEDINRVIRNTNEPKYFVMFREYLDKTNFDKLNSMLSIYIKFKTIKSMTDDFILNDYECGVCYENKINVMLRCKHKFCPDCCLKLKECPLCRANIN